MCLRSAVKVATVDPKSRLRDISREIAQKAGEMRGTPVPRKDSERSGQRRPESHYRGTASHSVHTQRPTFHSCSPYVTGRITAPRQWEAAFAPSCSSDLSAALCI